MHGGAHYEVGFWLPPPARSAYRISADFQLISQAGPTQSDTCSSRVEWRTRWHITIRWDRADNSPAADRGRARRGLPAELRHMVARARADPHVLAFRQRWVRELVGDEPPECRNGHG